MNTQDVRLTEDLQPRRELLPLASLRDWARNPRGGVLRGVVEFAERLAVEGIREDLHVFLLNGEMTIMQGHRRKAAGLAAGIEMAWCKVWPYADEREAFCHLIAMQNGSDPFDSRELAMAAAEAMRMGMAKEDLVAAFHRSEETVQLYLDLRLLPHRAQEAVWRGELGLGAAGLLRSVPAECREEAVQALLAGALGEEEMSEVQARNYIEHKYLRPARYEREWQKKEIALKRKLLVADGYHYVPFAERGMYALEDSGVPQAGYDHEDSYVPALMLVNPGAAVRWGDLAGELGVPLYVVPAPVHVDKYCVLVRMEMVRQADALRAEGERVLGDKKSKKGKAESGKGESDQGGQEAGRSAHAPLNPLAFEDQMAKEEASEQASAHTEEVWTVVRQVIGALQGRPEVAMRDRCFTPLMARMFWLLEGAGLPAELLMQLQRAYEGDNAARKGLRWGLTLLMTAELWDAEDDEVTGEVLRQMGVAEK